MLQLSGTDALFLAMETPDWHQHIGALTILDPSGVEGFGYDTAVAHLESRLALTPKFRWKLKQTPLRLGRPIWVEDPHFDLARHVQRIAVPSPGGRVEVSEVLSQLMTRQLDRRHPLWQFYFVEGLANGRVGFIMKIHHSLMDGVSGASLASVLMDLEPDPPAREIPDNLPILDREPSHGELFARAAIRNFGTPIRLTRYMGQVSRRGIAALEFNRTAVEPAAIGTAPTTRWNAPVGPRRISAFASVSLDDIKRIRKKYDVKVNDVILAICAGALRTYLDSHDELPESSLTAMVPISTRGSDDGEFNNQIANMNVSLFTDIDNPVQRLKEIARASKASKAMTDAIRAHKIQSLGETAPPLVLGLAIRALAQTGAMSAFPTVANTLVSNVPGPPFPLYFAGARTTGMFPGSVITETMGLNFTVFSYLDRVDFGLMADPELVPDLWDLAEMLNDSMASLLKAARLGKATKTEDAFGE